MTKKHFTRSKIKYLVFMTTISISSVYGMDKESDNSFFSGFNSIIDSIKANWFGSSGCLTLNKEFFIKLPPDVMSLTTSNLNKIEKNNIFLTCRALKEVLDTINLQKGILYLLSNGNLWGKSVDNKALKEYEKLKHLNLSKNTIITDAGISNLTKLETLSLGANNNISIDVVKRLTNLTSLDLAENEIINNECINELRNLTSLNLRLNKRIICFGINCPVNLMHLNLDSNNVITDKELNYFKKLTVLNLSDNGKITDRGIQNLTGLTSLNLRNNKNITYSGMSLLTNLTDLNLDNNRNIPDLVLGNFEGLTSLNLDNNYMIAFIGKGLLPKLKILSLDNNERFSDAYLDELKRRNPPVIIQGKRKIVQIRCHPNKMGGNAQIKPATCRENNDSALDFIAKYFNDNKQPQ